MYEFTEEMFIYDSVNKFGLVRFYHEAISGYNSNEMIRSVIDKNNYDIITFPIPFYLDGLRTKNKYLCINKKLRRQKKNKIIDNFILMTYNFNINK